MFLKILARGATGQKMSVYTSLITGARRPGELDGPEEFHLVLLDNGRTRILGGPLRESLFCIRCGACLNACPIFRNIGGHAYGGIYSGPIGAVLTPLYDGLAANHHLPHASSLCGAVPGGLPCEDRHSRDAHPAARAIASRAGRAGARGIVGLSHLGPNDAQPDHVSVGTVAGNAHGRTHLVGSVDAKTAWRPKAAGPNTRDFPAPRAERFRDWWESEGKEGPQ